jgi:NADH-quinone oxidoreductase subunit L
MHHEQDMKRMGGLRKYMPITFATMLIGWLAISGVPLLSGFFSKDEILYRSFITEGLPEPWPVILWAIGAITALITAVYMTRLMSLTFWGKERFEKANVGESHGQQHEHDGLPHESPRSMLLPLVILAAGAVLAGYLGVPEGLSGGNLPNYFERLIEPSIAKQNPPQREASTPVQSTGQEVIRHGVAPSEVAAEHGVEVTLTLVSVIIALGGIGSGWVWFRRKPMWEPPSLLEHKYYVDELYDATIVQPIKVGSINLLWKFIDVRIIDGAVNGAGELASLFGGALRYLQSGLARGYVAMVVLGALLIIGYFVFKISM